ncbi:MAG: hypothetical protein KDA41_05905, partial [Planctomycetales bacterium]|nr:hypothetical protein [Planctomycetales bacterium]
MKSRSSQKFRRGVTLLELVLALGLAAVVMAAIAYGIRLQLRAVDTRRTRVEESQLARALLKMIGDDLRSAVGYSAADFGTAAELASNGVSGAVGNATGTTGSSGSTNSSGATNSTGVTNVGGATNSTGAAGSANSAASAAAANGTSVGAAADDADQAAQDFAADLTPTTITGVYGNQQQLQVDISRLPRLEDFHATLSGSDDRAADLPSDVKTV